MLEIALSIIALPFVINDVTVGIERLSAVQNGLEANSVVNPMVDGLFNENYEQYERFKLLLKNIEFLVGVLSIGAGIIDVAKTRQMATFADTVDDFGMVKTAKAGENAVDVVGFTCTNKGINLIDDFDTIVDDIININKKYDIGLELHNKVDTIINSALYYDDYYEQVASISRSISQHTFANGNKRTAVDTIKMLISKMNLQNTLNDTQIWNLVLDMSIPDGLSDVTEIAKILRGE